MLRWSKASRSSRKTSQNCGGVTWSSARPWMRGTLSWSTASRLSRRTRQRRGAATGSFARLSIRGMLPGSTASRPSRRTRQRCGAATESSARPSSRSMLSWSTVSRSWKRTRRSCVAATGSSARHSMRGMPSWSTASRSSRRRSEPRPKRTFPPATGASRWSASRWMSALRGWSRRRWQSQPRRVVEVLRRCWQNLSLELLLRCRWQRASPASSGAWESRPRGTRGTPRSRARPCTSTTAITWPSRSASGAWSRPAATRPARGRTTPWTSAGSGSTSARPRRSATSPGRPP
mmetsp:Transcript_102620/g.275937  ORF Transcript_102620/g.275937 Transcript_102620/m.275937 type:complete len:291 (-) Transcript_102620:467-1339(-)